MVKATTTIFSKRIRKSTLNSNVVEAIGHILHIQNEAKIKAYSVLAYNKLEEVEKNHKSLHMYIKNLFGLNTYYTNFAVTEAKWNNSSNRELQKLYIDDIKDNIKHRKEYIKKQEKKLAYWNKIKKYMISVSKDIKKGVKPKMKKFMPFMFFEEDNKILVDACYLKGEVIYSFYLFEAKVVNNKLSTLKNKIHMLKKGLEVKENKLKRISESSYKSCFGSKKLFKEQFSNYKDNHKLWKEKFNLARHKSIQIQGCNTATQGNFCVRYNPQSKVLNLMLPMQNEPPKSAKKAKSEFIDIQGVEFTYNKNLYLEALNRKGSPISYRIEDYGHYYIIKATVEVVKDDKYINFSKVDGIIGYDINVDHVAYAETDSIGNLISFGTIPFNIDNVSTGRSTKIIEQIAIDLVNIARGKNKPLVGEDIENIKKGKLTYGNKNKNKKISIFAHKKLITSIKSRAFKESLEVSYINPAYTSFIGKLKYMKAKGLSVHVSAAYCVARRGLEYTEKLKQYSKFKMPWKKLSPVFKNTWVSWFYNTPNINNFNNIKDYVEEIKILNKSKKLVKKEIRYIV